MKGICSSCGAPVKSTHEGWVHDQTLGELRVTQFEVDLIAADPPLAAQPLHRETVLHQPNPI